MLSAVAAFPQNAQDSVAKKAKDGNGAMKGLSVSELFAVGEKTFGGSGDYGSFRNFKGHWKGYYIGFMNLVNLPDGMEGLEVKRGGSFNMQFNFANYSINLNKRGNFGLQTGLGLEYQRLRFDNPGVTLAKIDGKVVPASTAFEGNDHTVRSVFKNFYLTVPMMFPVLQIYCLGLFTGFFNAQGPLFAIYGNRLGAAPENTVTFGYYMTLQVIGDVGGNAGDNRLNYGFTTAANLTIGLVSIPIIWGTKKLFDRFDPEAEF